MFSDPQKNLEQFGLSPEAHVADLGSGSGFYTLAAARIVGATGRVYAIDVQKGLLEKVANEARHLKLANVETLCGDLESLEGSRLSEASVDAVLVCNILFQLENKENFLLEIKRILKPKGRVLVVDWRESFGGTGPQPNMIVSPSDARAIFEKVGFVFERDINAGAHHYGMIFVR